MKIAIINDVHIGMSLTHGNKVRASSEKVMDMFEPFLCNIVVRHKPDLLVNLGDLIRSESKNVDLHRYNHLMELYKSLQLPTVHLLGNHEIKHLNQSDIELTWKQYGFNQKSYGFKSLEDIDIVWLGITEEEGHPMTFLLPSDQLNWLKHTLDESTKPLLIFTHCAIDDQDVCGNFFYEALDGREKNALFLKNQREVRKIIHSKQNTLAVFQAHLHYFHAQVLNEIPYITCPAMSENICGPDISNNIPEIYTIVTIEKNQFTAKAYSREYCFAGYEQRMPKQLSDHGPSFH